MKTFLFILKAFLLGHLIVGLILGIGFLFGRYYFISVPLLCSALLTCAGADLLEFNG